jgi:phosphate transport system protein
MTERETRETTPEVANGTQTAPAAENARPTDARPFVAPHTFHRRTLEREMREIQENVLRMGGLVTEAVDAAIASLVNHDVEAATAVIVGDRRVNEMQRLIQEQIITVIATQQPVARDLRYLLALDHVAYELERMGDHAASVAKQARKLAAVAPLRRWIHLPEIAEMAATVVNDVLRALVDVDPDEARAAAKKDDEIDHLYHRTFDEVLELMRADPANVEPGARVLFAGHYLERIGDRATNIAEDVVFLASGQVEDLNS